MRISLLLTISGLTGWLSGTTFYEAYAQNLSFSPVTTYSSGINAPTSVALGDVTGDGVIDLAVANLGNRALCILPGVGDGTFGPVSMYPINNGSSSQTVKLGDLNNDGRLDAVLSNGNELMVLLNVGNGAFSPATAYPLVSNSNIALADFNGDGLLDVATPYYLNGMAYVLLNKGNGVLGPATGFLVSHSGSSPESLALGDVTGDSFPDIVVATGNGSTVVVLPGTGKGDFGSPQELGGGASSWVTLGDVNNDGKLDILANEYPTPGLVTYLSQGNGRFLYSPQYQTTKSGTDNLLADLNGDGFLDVVAPIYGSSTLDILPGLSSGGFDSPLSFFVGMGSSPIGANVADLNKDGLLDIVTANYGSSSVGVLLNSLPLLSLSSLPSGSPGASLTLQGQRLAGATAVTFTDVVGKATAVAAASFTATNYTATPNSITLAIPAALGSGKYDVRVLTPHGTTNATPLNVAGTLAAISPALQTEAIVLAPNPAHESTTLTITAAPTGSPMQLQLLDAQGRTVRACNVPTPTSQLILPLDVKGLASGLYLLRLETGEWQATRRLLVR